MKFWLHVAAGCLCCCVAEGSQAQTMSLPDAPELARLRAGEIVIENSSSDEDGSTVSILAFMHAPAERIWEIIISCRYVHAFVSGLEFCEVLEERGDYALTRQVVDKGWMMPRMDFTFETRREPYRHMDFRLTRGNLKTMQGSWDFETFPEGVLVRHVLALQPLLPAPRWLVRRNLKEDLPDMLRCIRGLAAGSGSGQETGEDLGQCPGKVRDQ
jgi:ribosome-associated toxin RatA of RatAB toxin-antitoxin module